MSGSVTKLPDAGQGGVVARFFRGAGYLVGALPWLLRNAPLRRLIVIPVMLNLVLLASLVTGAVFFTWSVMGWLWARPEGWLVAVWYVGLVLVGLALVAASYAVFMVLAGLVGASFYDKLSVRTEELERACDLPEEPLTLGGVVRGIGSELGGALRGLASIVLVTLPLFALNLVPVVGSLLYAGVNLSMAAYTSALGGISPPAERRGYSRKARSQTVRQNLALCMGFGAAAAVLLLVPVVNLAVVPLSVVGGTRLFLHLEAHGRTALAAASPGDDKKQRGHRR